MRRAKPRPPSAPVTLAPRVRAALAAVAAVSVTWAVVVWITGGTAIDLGVFRVSSRSPVRPALLALLALAAATWGTTAIDRRASLARARQRGDRLAPAAAVLLALSVGTAAALFGGHVAAAADASGYVSQSRLWGQGRIRVPAPDLTGAPWPERGWLVAPLGYAPSHVAGELAPTYAPGLPWLMAFGAAVLGEGGRYVWTPLFVALLVWGTFRLARREAPPLVALSAATLVATSPPVLFAAMQTMSDLPAAALWLGALLTLGSNRAAVTLVSGTLAALALVVRPNLVALAVALWTANLAARTWARPELPGRLVQRRHRSAAPLVGVGSDRAPDSADGAPAVARLTPGSVAPVWVRGLLAPAMLWAMPVALAALAIAAVNTALWGAPIASGYGANADLFMVANVPRNLARLGRWTVETGGGWSLVGVAGAGWAAMTGARRRTWPALAVVIAVVASYLVYAVFEEWWYLRFYLPAWPVLATAAAVAGWRALARWHDDGAAMAVVAVALTIGVSGVSRTAAVGAFDLWRSEQRYAATAAFVAAEAPRNAVVLSVQHSGAVAYYSGRTIARWDYVTPGALDDFCAGLAAAGRAAWLVVDDWEEAPFRQRFAGDRRGRLDWAPLGEARVGAARVRVYDLTTPTRAMGPALIPIRSAWSWPWRRVQVPATAK